MFEDLVVVELASVLAGPAVGMFFAELGARVIKVENPDSGGDVTRSWMLAGEDPKGDISSYFSSVNWGKSSIAVNARTPGGREVICDLACRADVLIASYKPGDDVRLGLDYPTLAKLNPRLIYGQITGYGRDDPRAGYDAILQAASGFMAMNGTPESGPVKMPVALIDVMAAHQLKEGLLLALIHRQNTGRGGMVHVSLLQAGIASLANQATNWLVAGKVPRRIGSEHPNIVPYGSIFITRDGQELLLGVGTDSQFAALCKVLGCPEAAQSPHFSSNPQRVRHRDELRSLLAERIRRFDRDALLEKLAASKVPAGGILTMPEVFEQPQSREMLLFGETADIGALTGLRTAAFSGDFLDSRRQLDVPPRLNENAGSILRDFLQYPLEKQLQLQQEGAMPTSDQKPS